MSNNELLKISNPPPGHPGVIGVKHAERWVRQGRAFFEVGGKLRLLEKHRVALGNGMRRMKVSGRDYDAIGRPMRTEEIRHIPIAQPPPRPTKRRMVTALAKPGIVRVRYQ